MLKNYKTYLILRTVNQKGYIEKMHLNVAFIYEVATFGPSSLFFVIH